MGRAECILQRIAIAGLLSSYFWYTTLACEHELIYLWFDKISGVSIAYMWQIVPKKSKDFQPLWHFIPSENNQLLFSLPLLHGTPCH
jgi:hypothetical protein